jgi:hypothetical protein
MCTMTVVPLPSGTLRVAFNRDESRTREVALPPRIRPFGPRQAILPIDPQSGGTWLAVNDAGLILGVLNRTLPGARRAKGARSRGEMIPTLLGCSTPTEALTEIERSLDYRDFAPFRLILIERGLLAEVEWNGERSAVVSRVLVDAPLLATSSGLGDHLVDGVRLELFRLLFDVPPEDWQQVQDRFHRHSWAGREHLSVNMARDSSRTVSHSVIELDPESALFAYYPDWPNESPSSTHSLGLTEPPRRFLTN